MHPSGLRALFWKNRIAIIAVWARRGRQDG